MIKCSVLPNDNLLLAIIRRMDLDADAKLNFREFIDAIRPIENFTAKQANTKPKEEVKLRPKTALRSRPTAPAEYKTYNHLSLTPETEQKPILKKTATPQSRKLDFIEEHEMADEHEPSPKPLGHSQPRIELEREKQEQHGSQLLVVVRDVFQDVLALENGLELQRAELASRRDFTLSCAFNYFAKSAQYKIDQGEFLFGLERLQLKVRRKDVSLFFARYDSDQDGKLGFWEFCNSLLPIEIRARTAVEQRQLGQEMTYETRELFMRILRKTIDSEVQMEMIR